MDVQLHAGPAQNADLAGVERAYVLLETSRLRCEALMDRQGRGPELLGIHRELGTAAFQASEEFGAELRRSCLGVAHTSLADESAPGADPAPEVPHLSRILALMFSEAIAASDSLAGEIALHPLEDAQRDRLHLVHAHVMAACELLDEHLTALELDGAGPGGAG